MQRTNQGKNLQGSRRSSRPCCLCHTCVMAFAEYVYTEMIDVFALSEKSKMPYPRRPVIWYIDAKPHYRRDCSPKNRSQLRCYFYVQNPCVRGADNVRAMGTRS